MVYHSVYGERVRYKINKPILSRKQFSKSCREKFLYPVIVTELVGNDNMINKDLELSTEGHLSLSNLNSYLREKFKLTQNEGILVYCETKNEQLILPSLSQTIDVLYKENMNEIDRNLYLIVTKQEMYG